jgi:quercetin dioxygenase-like cupin family protein
MMETRPVGAAIAGLDVGVTTSARPSGMAQLTVLHREAVDTMPAAAEQEIRVIQAVLQPGDRTPHHTHRHPVTVYMLEGEFTLEFAGLPTAVVRAGEVFVEPAGVAMTGYNRGTEVPARMVIFYACAPDEPFADPV